MRENDMKIITKRRQDELRDKIYDCKSKAHKLMASIENIQPALQEGNFQYLQDRMRENVSILARELEDLFQDFSEK